MLLAGIYSGHMDSRLKTSGMTTITVNYLLRLVLATEK